MSTTESASGALRLSNCFSQRVVLWTWAVGSGAGVAAGIALSMNLGSPLGVCLAPVVGLPIVVAALLVSRWLRPDEIDPRRHLLPPSLALVVVFGAREGLFGDVLRYDSTWYGSHGNSVWKWKSQSSQSTTIGEPRSADNSTIGSRASVTVMAADGGGGGQIIDALRDTLRRRAWPSNRLAVNLTVDAPDSWCFLPLYKSGTVTFVLELKAKWTCEMSSGEVEGTIAGTIEQTMTGIASRRNFNEKIAEQIAEMVAEKVDKAITPD